MRFDNPHRVTVEEDRILVPPAGVANWSENINFCCPTGLDDGRSPTGVYAHLSRMCDDPEIWEGVFTVFLPDGVLLVNRSFGRSPRPDVASSGQLTFTVPEPLEQWTMRFDGMARRVDRSVPAAGFVPDGPVELVQVDLTLDAASPVWSMGPALGQTAKEQSWASMHLEQSIRVRGTITTREQTVEMDHIAIRDHSAGVRHYGPLLGEAWASCAFPSGKVIAGLQIWQRDGFSPIAHGYLFDGEKMHDLRDVTLEPLTSPQADPQEFVLEFDGPYGRSRITGQMQSSMVFTLDEPIGMPLGTDLGGGLFATEGPARYQWDGEEALGWMERTIRASEIGKTPQL